MGTKETSEISSLIENLFEIRANKYEEITLELLSLLDPVKLAFNKYLLTIGVESDLSIILDLIAEENPDEPSKQIFTFEIEAHQTIETSNGIIKSKNIFYVQLDKTMLVEANSDVIFNFLLDSNLDMEDLHSNTIDDMLDIDEDGEMFASKQGRVLH